MKACLCVIIMNERVSALDIPLPTLVLVNVVWLDSSPSPGNYETKQKIEKEKNDLQNLASVA